MPTPKPEQIQQALALLFQPGDTVEMRAIGPRIVSGYYRDQQKLAEDSRQLNSEFNPPLNICVCLNPTNPQLYARRPDQFAVARKGEGTANEDILCRRWLLVDVDAGQPSGVSATEEQRGAAIDLAKQVYCYLTQQLGFPKPVVADSGNGHHLLIRLADLPNTQDTRGVCERFLLHLHEHCKGPPPAHVDREMFNAARICCLYGTRKVKGADLPETPHRLSKLLDVPDPLQPVTLEQLLAVSGPMPEQKTPAASGQPGATWDIPALLEERGVEYEQDEYQTASGEQATRYVLEICPFNSEHNNAAAYLLQWGNGAVAFGCHHDGCSAKDWQALKAHWGLPAGSQGITEADITLPAMARQGLLIVSSLDVQPENVDWLWEDRLVMGGINLFCGRGGLGKTYQTCDLVARISNKGLLAPNGQALQHGRVLYSSAEDHIAKIIEPRMQAHGVNRALVDYIKGQPVGEYVRLLDVITHCDLLDDALTQRPDTVALVLDPISAFSGDCDSNKVASVRRFTGVLSQLAEKHNIAILGVHHFNKGKREIAGDSISGSHAYRDAARSIWLFALDANDLTRRLMVSDKHNWAQARPLGLAYRIEFGVIQYEQEPLEMTSDELLNQGKDAPVDVAVAWLLAKLGPGKQPAADVQIAATVEGIKDRTLQRAKARLNVVSAKEGNKWFWELPTPS